MKHQPLMVLMLDRTVFILSTVFLQATTLFSYTNCGEGGGGDNFIKYFLFNYLFSIFCKKAKFIPIYETMLRINM